ncbi:hypothetical protein [Flaviflagellibacter deserti]|uniref:Tetratricopeptide repeat protein n=1 Tax=Flaviflagellibacter deserti TaxID=2267266 RepID=A0ABV9YYM3_9HYPH
MKGWFMRRLQRQATEECRPKLALVSSDSQSPVEAEEAYDVLERLLADDRLRLSERNRRFLRFVVEETLAGRSERIKSYTIAVDVFGRGEAFDGGQDPIVRIEANRIRTALSAYYEGPGASEGIRIELTKGGYVPTFSRREDEPQHVTEPEQTSRLSLTGAPVPDGSPVMTRPWFLASCAAAFAGLFILALAASNWTDRSRNSGPAIFALREVRSLTPNESGSQVAHGLTQSLVSSISRFSGIRLVLIDDRMDIEKLTLQNPANRVYAIDSTVRMGASSMRFWWSVSDARNGETIWSEVIDRGSAEDAAETIEDHIAGQVAARIAEPIATGRAATFTLATAPSGDSYECVLQARAQLSDPQRQRGSQVRHCLEQAIGFSPQYSDAWALLAMTYVHESTALADRTGMPPFDRMALDAAERSVHLAPRSSLAYLALFSAQFRLGDFGAADQSAQRAIELNPNDPEILYQSGARAYVRGSYNEGMARIRQSIDLTARPRTGTQFFLALDSYRLGDNQKALELIGPAASSGLPLPQTLMAAINASLGRTEIARSNVRDLLKVYPGYETRLRSDLAQLQHFNGELTELIVDGARGAGLAVR